MAFSHKALGYVFLFKDLTWKEEIGAEGQRGLLARSLYSISDRALTVVESAKILETFPDKAIEALFLMYQEQLPEDKEWSVEIPWSPPPVSRDLIKQAIPQEEEDGE